jgi:hypothetical protein
MPVRGASHYRVRSIALGVVIGGHVAVLAVLAIQQRSPLATSAERMTLLFLDSLEHTSAPRPVENDQRRPVARHPTLTAPTPSVPPPTDAPDAIQLPDTTNNLDWYAHGAEAAQRAAAEPTTRGFGFPKHQAAPRQKKEFHWDKTHTDRVHALEGGGIGVRLNDNCELAIAPFPFVGCALGKRKARGDLFDEMKAPVEPGDWKEH